MGDRDKIRSDRWLYASFSFPKYLSEFRVFCLTSDQNSIELLAV